MRTRNPSLRGDEERNALVLANQGIVFYTVRRLLSPATLARIGKDDVYQTAQLGLLRAAETWDPTLGRFSTHAYWQIRGALAHLVYRDGIVCLPANGRKKYRDLEKAVGARRVRSLSQGTDLPAEAPEEEEDWRLPMLRQAVDRLPETLRVAVRLRLRGLREREIGRRLGISVPAVGNRFARALRLLRAALAQPSEGGAGCR